MKATAMKAAHRIAKQINDGTTYATRLRHALRNGWQLAKEIGKKDIQALKRSFMADNRYERTYRACLQGLINALGTIAMATNNKFIDSVCAQFCNGRTLSEKQAYWLAKFATELAA
jgi:hypothetical protein